MFNALKYLYREVDYVKDMDNVADENDEHYKSKDPLEVCLVQSVYLVELKHNV